MLYPISDVIIHCEPDYLEHYGITGQKWGIRRYQNKDGSLTPAGKKRYGSTLDEVREKYNQAENVAKSKRLRAEQERQKNNLQKLMTLSNSHTQLRKDKAAYKAERKAYELEKAYNNLENYEKGNITEKDARKLIERQDALRQKNLNLAREQNKILDRNNVEYFDLDVNSLPEKDRKKFNSLSEEIKRNEKMIEDTNSIEAKYIENRYKNSDNMSSDELFKLSSDTYDVYMHSLGTDRADKLGKMMEDLDNKAVVKSLDEVSKMKPGRQRDKKAETLLKDTRDESSTITGVLYDRIVKSHGKIDREAAEERLEEYCEQLLKEMNLPITETTLKQMSYVVTAG